MFIRETKKTNVRQGKVFFQYVLVQAQRINGKSRQRNILYLGSHKFLKDKGLRQRIAKALEHRIYNILDFADSFSYYAQLGGEYQKWVDAWYVKYLEKQQEDGQEPLSKPVDGKTATFEEVDTSSVDTGHCREVGAEWLCLQMAKELQIKKISTLQRNGPAGSGTGSVEYNLPGCFSGIRTQNRRVVGTEQCFVGAVPNDGQPSRQICLISHGSKICRNILTVSPIFCIKIPWTCSV